MNGKGYDRCRLGLNIRRRRQMLHLTQAELAARVQCSAGMISQVEKGKQDLTVERFFGLCCALECPMQELLQGVE